MKITTRRKTRDHTAPSMGKSVRALAKKGRAGDTEVAHLTPGEVVVPKRVWEADPGLRAQASMAMQQAGLDPSRYVVGSSRNSRNPRTGAREFADLAYVNGQWVNSGTGQAADFSQDQNSFANTGSYTGGNVAPTSDPNQIRPPRPMSAGQRNWGSDANQQINQELANITGFQGDFGGGGFSAYMQGANDVQKQNAAQYLTSQGQGNRIDWNTGLTAPVDEPNDPNASGSSMPGNRNWGASQNATANQGLANLTGYTGDFGGGAFNNWLATQPQSVTNQVGQYLFDNGQADRANLYAWDRNGNGAVEGTEAAGVIDNGDGTYVFPGGFERGRAIDPFYDGNGDGKPDYNIYQINPNIPGAPPAYEWGTAPGGMMPAGAWPETMMDPIRGTTTYWSAPPPGADGQWDNPQFLPWDVRNGGTGDPYVPWTEEWARQQAADRNGYAAQALQGAGVDLTSMAPNGNIAALTSGQGASNAAGYDRGWQAQGYYQTKDGVWQTMDGVLVIPQGNGLFLDTMYGFLRNAQGIIVNPDGSPVITQYNAHTGAGSDSPWRVFGSSGAMSMMGQFAGVDLGSLNDGNNTPIVGNYGGGTPTPIRNTFQGRDIVTDIRGDPWATSVYNRATGSPGGPAGAGGGYVSTAPVNTGGTTNTGTNTGTNGQTTSGLGLTPGTLNPYSMPLGYGGVNLFLGGMPTGQTNTGTNTGQQQSYVDPLSWLSLLNLGYGSSTYGQPTYQSADPGQGGINYVTPNSQTVEFRSPFAYY